MLVVLLFCMLLFQVRALCPEAAASVYLLYKVARELMQSLEQIAEGAPWGLPCTLSQGILVCKVLGYVMLICLRQPIYALKDTNFKQA